MKIILPGAQDHLKNLQNYLNEIYKSLDQTFDNINNWIYNLKNTEDILEQLLQYCQSDDLIQILNDIFELSKKLNNINLSLHPGIINEVKNNLEKCEKLLEEGITQKKQLCDQITEIYFRLTQQKMKINAISESLSSHLKYIDNTTTVMQRQLSHLDYFIDSQSTDFKTTAQIVSDILILSLQLAELIFPPQQNEKIKEIIPSVQKNMSDWILNLADYLEQVNKFVSNIAQENPDYYNQTFKNSFEHLQQICQKIKENFMPKNE